MPTLGEQLKALRAKKRMTQEELAQRLNTTKAAISRYENDQRQPKLEVLTDMAVLLEANPDELFNLYFRAEDQQGADVNKGTLYLNALSKWIQTVMPNIIDESSDYMLDDWLSEISSPFAFYNAEDLTVVKKIIEALLVLDRSWKDELLEDASRYLEFQEQKKAKLNKLKQDVE